MSERIRFVGRAPQELGEAPIRHAETDTKTQRDRFENRIFASKKLFYRDREGNENKSIILISPEGQELLGDHAHLLTALDEALLTFGPKVVDRTMVVDKEPHEILQGKGSIQFMAEGGQSMVYRLDIASRSFVLKIHLPYGTVYQPYTNEMLEIQSVAKDRSQDLSDLGIAMPTIYFATNDIICEEYVPDELEKDDAFAPIFYATATIAEEYIEMNASIPLWRNVHVDKNHKSGTPVQNFRKRSDGTIVWIDPFAYSTQGIAGPKLELSKIEKTALPKRTPKENALAYATVNTEIETFTTRVRNIPDGITDEDWVAQLRPILEEKDVVMNGSAQDAFWEIIAAERNILKKHGVRWIHNEKLI